MVAMAATTLLTSDQFLAMPEDNQPPPPTQHDIVRRNLLEILFAYTSADRSLGLKVLPLTAFVAIPGSVSCLTLVWWLSPAWTSETHISKPPPFWQLRLFPLPTLRSI
jgi:hypothetical protein